MASIQEQVTATMLARHLSEMIDRVRISGKRLSITRGNREVAQLTPPSTTGASSSVLLSLLSHNALGKKEQNDYSADLEKIRKSASLPSSPWE